MDLAEVADELYGGLPAEFVAARAEQARVARAAGDRQLAADILGLRKPSTAAWAINLTVRAASAEIDRVLDLGDALREAQESLDGAELRELIQQRQALVGALVTRVREVAREAGQRISDAVASEVEQTFRAAMADPEAARAVRSRRLVGAIPPAGLDKVDLASIVADVPEGGSSAREAGSAAESLAAKRARTEARRRVAVAEGAAVEADDRVQVAERAVGDAELEIASLRTTIADLRQRLGDAEDDLADAEHELGSARSAVSEAVAAASSARQELDDARSALDRLDPGR